MALSFESFQARMKPGEPLIFLLNNTFSINIDVILNLLPKHISVFSNQTVLARYQNSLSGHTVHLLNSKNAFSFRPFIRQIAAKQPVFVFLDTDQASFQTIGYLAYRKKTTIIPIAMPNGKSQFLDEINIGSELEVVPQIQSYLLKSSLKTQVNLFNELITAAGYFGEDEVICKDITGKITYRDLLLNSYVFSQRLKKVLPKNNRKVAVLLPNSIGNVVTLFALFYQNFTPVMLNYSAGVQTILDACETAGISVVLTSREFIDKGQLGDIEKGLQSKHTVLYLEQVRSQLSMTDKLAGYLAFRRRKRAKSRADEVVLFTSGSEYRPRGIVLSHDNLFANIQQTKSVIDFGNQDKMLNSMPMFHSFGLTAGSILPLLTGIQTYLYPSPLHYKRIPELIAEEGSTIMFGTSAFLEKYGSFAEDNAFRTMRYAVVGADKLKSEVERYWRDRFGIQILQGYGATETAPIMSLDTPVNHKQGSVGRFLPGIRHRLEPVEGIETGGNLLIQGPNLMKGYLQHGQGYVAQEGWYDTGDIVEVDERGFVTIVGRLKRFAKVGGEMVSLNLVEQLAAKAYNSTEFAAVNVPDDRRGEKIILTTTLQGLTLQGFQQAVATGGYSKLHVPSEIRHIQEFPLLGSGKTDYVALKSWLLNEGK